MADVPLRRRGSRFMSRRECEKCGETMESYKRVGRCVDDRCNGEMVSVRYLAADDVIEALENAYAPQGPLSMHPGDYLTKKFELPGHEGLEYV